MIVDGSLTEPGLTVFQGFKGGKRAHDDDEDDFNSYKRQPPLPGQAPGTCAAVNLLSETPNNFSPSSFSQMCLDFHFLQIANLDTHSFFKTQI